MGKSRPVFIQQGVGRMRKRRRQRGGSLDIQKRLSSLGMELHVPGYRFLGPGTRLKERLERGERGINRLDELARMHRSEERRVVKQF